MTKKKSPSKHRVASPRTASVAHAPADSTLAELLGSGLAVMQDGIDRATAWGLERMREAGKAPKNASSAASSKLARFGRGALSFFGALGTSYYDTYEDLKRKKH